MPIFEQKITIPTYASRPTTIKDGSFVYAQDTKRHYMVVGGTYYQVPNSLETTAVRFWDAGLFKNGTPVTGDILIMTDSVTTTSGNAVFNLTNDHTSTGTALCSSFITNGIVGNFVDSTGVYSQGLPSVAGNLKTVTIATTKQTQSGVVVLTVTVVGTLTQPAAPNGTVVRLFAIGVSI